MGVWGYGLWVMGGEKLYDSYISINGSLRGLCGTVIFGGVRVRAGFFVVICRLQGIESFFPGVRLFFTAISRSC